MLSPGKQALQRTGFWFVVVLSNVTHRLVERWIFPSFPSQSLHGFRVVILGASDTADAMFPRVANALSLIADMDPRRFLRMQGDIRQIVVTPLAKEGGAYIQRSRTCYLSEKMIASSSNSTIAIVLVHESTHARLDHAGIMFWRDRKARYERLCVLQEKAFTSMLPPSMREAVESRIRMHWSSVDVSA